MKFSSIGLLAGLAASVFAEDVLFVDTFEYEEYTEATTALGLTAKVVTEAEWATMTTAEFAAFKAIILADPDCSSDISALKFAEDTKAVWSPAVQGNIVLIGTDPTYHFGAQPGAKVLIDNAIQFAAAAKTSGGAFQTGLYFALSCYYNSVDSADVTLLSYFGDFSVRGNLDCYNKAHIVASSPALGTLDDAALSDWSCSVHEAFSKYPSVGLNGFQALAIAQDVIGDGSQTFGDGTIGLPYVISRGATPAGCGDGKWDASLGEECDDGNTVSGDGCSASCKCESGRPTGDGHCLPPLGGNTTSSSTSSSVPVTATPYKNFTVTTTTTDTATVTSVTTFTLPPYVTPSVPTGPKIIGIEIIIYVTIIEDCTTVGASTITSYITSICSTKNRPIWNTVTVGYPCYVCALASASITCPASSFITASTTSCISPPPSYTPAPPVIATCSTCRGITLTTCPAYTEVPSLSVYAVPPPTLGTHNPRTTTLAATVATPAPVAPTVAYTPPTIPTASVKPSAVPFTGAAMKMSVSSVGVVIGAAALLLAL